MYPLKFKIALGISPTAILILLVGRESRNPVFKLWEC